MKPVLQCHHTKMDIHKINVLLYYSEDIRSVKLFAMELVLIPTDFAAFSVMGKYNILHENPVGLSSITIPKPNLWEAIPVPAQAHFKTYKFTAP